MLLLATITNRNLHSLFYTYKNCISPSGINLKIMKIIVCLISLVIYYTLFRKLAELFNNFDIQTLLRIC